jgi:hypothetical protein
MLQRYDFDEFHVDFFAGIEKGPGLVTLGLFCHVE